jgi:hypothetical protein
MAYSLRFNIVIEALNLVRKNIYQKSGCLAISLSFSPCHRVLHRVLAWLAIGLEISITSYELQMLLQLIVACS